MPTKADLLAMSHAERVKWYRDDFAYEERKAAEKVQGCTFPVRQMPLADYTARVQARQPFTFQRYGDGDWNCIQRRHNFGDVDQATPGLRDAIIKTLEHAHDDERYIMSIYAPHFPREALTWLNQHAPHVRWHNSDIFAYASRDGELYPFIQAVRELGLPVVVVGPAWLRRIDHHVFDIARFIEVSVLRDSPTTMCAWNDWQRVLAECLEIRGPALFSFSMGLAAKITIWKLFGKIGQQSWLLDVGSLWDPYGGEYSRKYHWVMDESIIRANLGGGNG